MKSALSKPETALRRSAYDALAHVTAEISGMLERGVMPWRAPWDHAEALALTPGLPLRSTGEPYRGANVMLLWAAQIARGYSKRTWLTFRQALELVGMRKGEEGLAGHLLRSRQSRSRTTRARPLPKMPARPRVLSLPEALLCVQRRSDRRAARWLWEEVTPPAAEPGAIEQWTSRAGVGVRIGGSMACYVPVTDLCTCQRMKLPLSSSIGRDFAARACTSQAIRADSIGLVTTATDRRRGRGKNSAPNLVQPSSARWPGLAPFHLEDHASYIANWLELFAR
ncbi:MAG: ArdC family protein [Caulobacteraceae bacterium]|nr:ArdC family protein [Caulobacteraceae bacterium]